MPKGSNNMTESALVGQKNTGVEEVEFKMIKVSPETHRKLLKLGSKAETFDEIIRRLIKEHEERATG